MLAGWAAPLALVLVVIALVLGRSRFMELDLQTASRVSLATTAVCYFTVVRRGRRGPWGLGPMLLLLVVLFHLGDMIMIGLGLPFSPDDRAYLSLWLDDGRLVAEAIYLSVLAVAVLSLAYVAAHPRRRAEDRHELVPTDHGQSGDRFATAGLILVTGGVLVYFARALTVAPGVLFSFNYVAYNTSLAGDRIVSLASLAVVIGLVLAAAAPSSSHRRAALWVFGAYALVLLPLGVRTAVLFPLAAAAVAMARRHAMPNGVKALAVVLIGLAAIGVIREARTPTGEFGVSDVAPSAALAEMGGSLRPLVETLSWQRVWHEDPYDGITYAAPVLRLAERVMAKKTPDPDPRLPSTLMQERVVGGQFGYSAVAEATLNFGTRGVIVIFAGFGLLAAALDRRGRSVRSAAVTGIVMAGIGLTVRNTFISLPSTIVAGFVVIFLVGVLTRRTAKLAKIPRPPDRVTAT